MIDNKLQPKRITDLVDNIDLYLLEMRKQNNRTEIPKQLNSYCWNYFRDINPEKEKLKSLGIFLADHMYRYAASTFLIDDYTRYYFATVFSQLWDTLQARGVDIFYVLDNKIRDDRFHLTIQLFGITGVAIVVPYAVNGSYIRYMTLEEQLKWVLSFDKEEFDPKKVNMTIDSSDFLRGEEVVDLIKKYIEDKRNIIYIEKDDSINYLDRVTAICRNSNYTGFMRNKAPDDPNVISLS